MHTFCLCSASATPYAAAKKAHKHAEDRAASQPCSGAVCACVGMYDFARVCLARGTLTNPSASPVGWSMGPWGRGDLRGAGRWAREETFGRRATRLRASAAQAMGLPLIGARLDTVHSGTANVRTVGIDTGRQKNERKNMAHWVGSAYRSSSLGLALRFLHRLHGGACDRQEVSAQASEQPHTSSNGRRGLDDGPIGGGTPGVPRRAGGFIGPGVSLLDLCSATKRTACTPLAGCTAWARGVCVASTRTRPHGVLWVTDRPMVPVHAYTYMHTHVHCMCVRKCAIGSAGRAILSHAPFELGFHDCLCCLCQSKILLPYVRRQTDRQGRQDTRDGQRPALLAQVLDAGRFPWRRRVQVPHRPHRALARGPAPA